MKTGGSEPKEASLSFFKVVRHPSAPLPLPTAFVNKYLEKIPKKPILKTRTGEHSWRLKIQKVHGKYCFTHGREKLVRDAGLRTKDVIVFWLVDPFTFLVSFLGEDKCEKDLPSINISDSGDQDDDGGSEEEEDDDDDYKEEYKDDEHYKEQDEYDDDDNNLSFQQVFSEKSHRYSMALPKKFVELAGLENESSVRIKDDEGKEWMIGLMSERYARTIYRLSSGWPLFRQYYKLSKGDICTFNFNKKQSVFIFKKTPTVAEEGVVGRPPTPRMENESGSVEAKRKRGRPPLAGGGVIEAEVVKRKRGRPPLKKPLASGGGGCVIVKDKIGNQSGPQAEAEVGVVKRKRGRPPLAGGGVIVVKRKRGRPPLACGGGGGGGGGVIVKDKIGNQSGPEVVKRKRGRPPLKKCSAVGGVIVEIRK